MPGTGSRIEAATERISLVTDLNSAVLALANQQEGAEGRGRNGDR
jgi:hypothetical protein